MKERTTRIMFGMVIALLPTLLIKDSLGTTVIPPPEDPDARIIVRNGRVEAIEIVPAEGGPSITR